MIVNNIESIKDIYSNMNYDQGAKKIQATAQERLGQTYKTSFRDHDLQIIKSKRIPLLSNLSSLPNSHFFTTVKF